jgi:hypothetical protein
MPLSLGVQKAFRDLAASSLAAALCAPAPAAQAHTTIQSQAAEGVQADNALKIGHGCEGKPVIAQSVVFPTDAPQIDASDPNAAIDDLGQVIEQGSIAGLMGAIQSRDIFRVQELKQDSLGNQIGFHATQGLLRDDLRGRVPFQFTGPTFTASSCATKLVVEIAVADVCDVRRPTIRPGKVNLWIPDNGSRFALAAAAAGVEGIGAPARLTVNRDLAKNPLDPACNGSGYTVTIRPTPDQIDRDLPIGRYWGIR